MTQLELELMMIKWDFIKGNYTLLSLVNFDLHK